MPATTIPDFTVEATGANRITVRWSEGEIARHFVATVNGDEITRVHGSTSQNRPTIFQTRPAIGRRARGIDYLDATTPEWVEFITQIRARVVSEKLATQAHALRAEEQAERRAETIRKKAEVVRRELEKLGVHNVETLNDGQLSVFYDTIQNSAW